MKINFVASEKIEEIEIDIKSKDINQDVINIIELLKNYDKEESLKIILGTKDDSKYFLEMDKIVRFFSSNKKNYALSNGNEYIIREKLYELEEKLDKKEFIRISNSEIISIKNIKKLDYEFSGNIKVTLKTGDICYISRSYQKKFKEIFGI